ncbi:hypothetical protein [Halosimplex halobium]|uniref:hypothetical protein n=1 Tax=Halosimplex halobium TaxID=3396618 RepID=UPI003F55B310
MAGDVEFGLYLLADDPSLTFIVFVGLVLLTVIAARFGAYAYLNMRATGVDAQRVLWEYLLYVGFVAACYGVVGILEIVSSVRTPYKAGLMLAVVLLLALAVREVYFNAALSTTGADRVFTGRRLVEVAFVAVVAAVVFGIAVFGLRRPLLALQGVGALAFAGYGFWFGRKQTAAAMVQGTMIDSLLRHLLPVLAFATLVPAVDLATVAGLDRVVVMHVQIVFVIMTATALMTATIKLRQNLAGL